MKFGPTNPKAVKPGVMTGGPVKPGDITGGPVKPGVMPTNPGPVRPGVMTGGPRPAPSGAVNATPRDIGTGAGRPPLPKGGMMKKGGVVSASKRADGIAQRGKTRGKMV